MPKDINISGQDIIKNLNKEIKRIRGATKEGLLLSAHLIKGESMARTPVDTGNLKGGHYVATGMDGNRIVAEIGMMAEYAIYVHENLVNFHPVGEAKFLANAVRAKATEVIKILQRTARVR